MKLVGDIAVEARHQHIRQIIDRSYGLSSLHASDPAIADPGPEGEEKIRRTRKAERARRRRALCDVHARLHREARLAAPPADDEDGGAFPVPPDSDVGCQWDAAVSWRHRECPPQQP